MVLFPHFQPWRGSRATVLTRRSHPRCYLSLVQGCRLRCRINRTPLVTTFRLRRLERLLLLHARRSHIQHTRALSDGSCSEAPCCRGSPRLLLWLCLLLLETAAAGDDDDDDDDGTSCGAEWNECSSSACCGDLVCHYQTRWYSQCLTECPPGGTCTGAGEAWWDSCGTAACNSEVWGTEASNGDGTCGEHGEAGLTLGLPSSDESKATSLCPPLSVKIDRDRHNRPTSRNEILCG